MASSYEEIIPISCPFAESGRRAEIPASGNADQITQATGIPLSYATPSSTGGSRMTVQQFNQLMYYATYGAYILATGHPVTFSETFSDAIGGYPKGAVLRYNGRNVVSLQDNNRKNFNATTDPYVIGSEVDGVVWWQYEDYDLNRKYFGAFPDLTNRTLLFSCDSATSTATGFLEFDTPWIYVELTYKVYSGSPNLSQQAQITVGNITTVSTNPQFSDTFYDSPVFYYGTVGNGTYTTSRLIPTNITSDSLDRRIQYRINASSNLEATCRIYGIGVTAP